MFFIKLVYVMVIRVPSPDLLLVNSSHRTYFNVFSKEIFCPAKNGKSVSLVPIRLQEEKA